MCSLFDCYYSVRNYINNTDGHLGIDEAVITEGSVVVV